MSYGTASDKGRFQSCRKFNGYGFGHDHWLLQSVHYFRRNDAEKVLVIDCYFSGDCSSAAEQ